jgi:hypothetical protein
MMAADLRPITADMTSPGRRYETRIMMDTGRGWILLLAIFAVPFLSVACQSSAGPQPKAVQESRTPSDTGKSQVVSPLTAAEGPTQPEGLAESPVQGHLNADAYRLAFKLRPDEATYLVVENEFRDVCGFPPLLVITTSVKEKRSIIQRVETPAPREKPASPPGDLVPLSWECDRYEVSEHGLKEETSFDSLRDLYPPPSLWPLGAIPGSVCTFLLDPKTGKTSHINLRPAQIAGGGSAAKLSKTAERCALTTENVQKLLDDLGLFYFPDSPKRVGEQWTKTYVEDEKAIGMVTTNVTCTLRSVREINGRQIATVAISSKITLADKSDPAGQGAAPTSSDRAKPRSQTDQIHYVADTGGAAPKPPNTQKPASQPAQQHYVLDKADCSGTVEFDLSRGELASMKLHRELEFFAPIESTQQSALVKEIRTGWAQDLRVTTSQTPPPKPVIVGGRKPPVVPVESKSHSGPATTQPAHVTSHPAPPARPPPPTRPATMPAQPRAPTSTPPVAPGAARGPIPASPARMGPPTPPTPPTIQPAEHH